MHYGYVLLNCDLGAEEYVLEEISIIPGVKSARLTFGAYDIIAEVETPTTVEFERTVATRIRKLTRVVSTITLNVISEE